MSAEPEPAARLRAVPGAAALPAALAAIPPEGQLHLDVREDLARGEEPFPRIMKAVRALGEGQVLALHVPFEPQPLYDVLGRRGFAHWAQAGAPGHWVVWFYREGSEGPPTAPPAADTPVPPVVRIDVRGLQPPLPMVRVLEALDSLVEGQRLEVLNARRPLFLYPQLDAQGFVHETDEPEPGIVRIVIRRPGPP